MKIWVGVTDNDWYEFLAARQPDEVNFWQPSRNRPFRALAASELFLFKLHSPINQIAGGGYFVRHSWLPVSLAWEVFRENNGVASLEELRSKIATYNPDTRGERDPHIGCIVLTQPFFWPGDEWIAVPQDWAPNIVSGKRYDSAHETGRRLLREVEERLAARPLPFAHVTTREEGSSYPAPRLVAPRLGQGGFRVVVTEAYHRRCAVTGEKVLPVLDAAHIKPYASEGPNDVRNGILLRQDIHTLFDRGYLTVAPDYRLHVSRKVREQFGNGEHYYSLHGQQLLVVPDDPDEHPAPEYLRWHNDHVFAE